MPPPPPPQLSSIIFYQKNIKLIQPAKMTENGIKYLPVIKKNKTVISTQIHFKDLQRGDPSLARVSLGKLIRTL